MLFLTLPDTAYRDSFIASLREFHEEGQDLGMDVAWAERDFDSFCAEIRSYATTAKPGLVTETHLWLIRRDGNGAEFVARGSIRHRLNDVLLRLGGHIGYAVRPTERRKGYGTETLRLLLPEAKALGINPVLVTCDADNAGSRKIIEANGGVFENAVPYRRGRSVVEKLRYWITV